MNWFTKENVANLSSQEKKNRLAQWGGCEHVTDNPDLLYTISYENDSMGREGYCLCEDCWDKLQEEEEEEVVTCYDCKKPVKVRDSIQWRWYDFYAPQGDEPIIVCNECKVLQKHIDRCEKDRRDYESEFGYDEDD